ncbi:toxin [Isoptericola sp. 4D.3]|uniref:Toxin n=1 Tax=Isoptericola peretonis TaxID=2918523 RepID=A0ABT0J772_9MICO|nr:toxin [Isoptericola sp. 4D.3]
MRRVSVVGAAGSGKSTFGRRLAGVLTVPHVELDALFWGPGWTPRPREEFVADAERELDRETWVVDGNYSGLQAGIWSRADTVVWLDLPRSVVMSRVYRRTLTRAVDRTELWPGTGNRQRWRDALAPWSRDSIVRFSWEQLQGHPERYGAAMAAPENARLEFHRLRSRAEVGDFLERAGG